MEEQTEMQLDQIREQIELLRQQAKKVVQRRQASFDVYRAKIGFEPLVGRVYHLYERSNGETLLSMIDQGAGKIPLHLPAFRETAGRHLGSGRCRRHVLRA